MKGGTEQPAAALVETIVRARCAPDVSALALRATIDFVLAQRAGMPDYLRWPLRIATRLFDLWAVIRTGRRFHHLSQARRWQEVRAWSASPIANMRDLIKFYETLAVFGWYSERYDSLHATV